MTRAEELRTKEALYAQYIIAETKILDGGQSYSIGDRTLDRGDLKLIQNQKILLEKQIRKLRLGGGIRIQRIVPRNL